jgi:transposase
VQVVQRWVLAALRKRQFFSLAELNEAIGELMGKLNRRPFRKLPGTREELYRSIDLPALRPLPAEPYVFAEWKRARVSIDYHIDLERHYYSVPYQLVGKEVDVRYTGTTVEILYQGKRVASHARSNRPGKHSTISEHRPKAHQKYLEWTPSRIVEWAATIGPFTAQLTERIMAERPHPEQGYRSCMGLIGLGRRYSKDRLEAAARRAVHLQAHSYQSVKSILARGLDRQSVNESVMLTLPVTHANIRGAGYYADSLFEEVAE